MPRPFEVWVVPDYWTDNRENLSARLSCFGSEYKMPKHFDNSFDEEEIIKLLA